MNPRRSYLYILMALVATARSIPQYVTGESFDYNAPDIQRAGSYIIRNCSSNAAALKTNLKTMSRDIQIAMKSTNSPAYKAFFRTTPAATVISVLEKIATGASRFSKGRTIAPTFCCLTNLPDLPAFAAVFQECIDNPSYNGFVATFPPNVFLCQKYFSAQSLPTSKDMCGTVSQDSTRLIQPISLRTRVQYALLLGSLASLYIPDVTGRAALRGSMDIDVNVFLQLPAERMVLSSNNYMLYVIYLMAGCTKFPDKAPIHKDRELLEVENSSNSSNVVNMFENCGSNTTATENPNACNL